MERFIQTLQQECFDYFAVFGEQRVNLRALETIAHYLKARSHHAKENDPLN